MLVLSRKCQEKLVIGGNITVTILEVRGGRVRLGIDAPADVAVHRLEVILRDAEAERGRGENGSQADHIVELETC